MINESVIGEYLVKLNNRYLASPVYFNIYFTLIKKLAKIPLKTFNWRLYKSKIFEEKI